MSNEKVIHIGGFSAFWGDDPTAAAQLVLRSEKLDYLIGDYLAEITLCLLARAKAKMAKAGSSSVGSAGAGGYITDFLSAVWVPLMKPIMKKNIKVLVNAGGMNPMGLKEAVEAAAVKAGVPVPKVGVVLGDDLTAQVDQLREKGALVPFGVNGEKENLWSSRERVMSSNAYLGAQPIARALAEGAQIVITGRCVDSALVLAPLIYEFGWKRSSYDLLSAGSLCGHIIECGAQCTGGNFTDWRKAAAKGWADVGFPIAECRADGSFVVTKPQNTGGIVSFGSVAEQMLYEIGDPAAYMLPDVVCDWRHVQIREVGEDRVSVSGARGRAPSAYYKVGTTTLGGGFKASGLLLISGFDASEKAQAVADGVLGKVKALLQQRGLGAFEEVLIEQIGNEATYGPLKRAVTREIVLRITVSHSDPKALRIFSLCLSPSATAMAPGITGAFGAGRPKATPRILYYSSLLDRSTVPVTVQVGTGDGAFKHTFVDEAPATPTDADPAPSTVSADSDGKCPFQTNGGGPVVRVPLIALCYGRSGDKGNVSNIGLICRDPRYFKFVRSHITPAVIARHLPHLMLGSIRAYELPGSNALNFVCTRSLGGGGVSSLHVDPQGKSYAQKLLSYEVDVPKAWIPANSEWLAPKQVSRL